MSKLTVIALSYDNPHETREARRALDRLDREYFELVDAAVITKDAEGRVDVDNELESSTKTGALMGGLLGGLFSPILPVAGAFTGATGGALVGKAIEPGLDQGFVSQVAEALKPDGSALVFLFEAYEKYELPDIIAVLNPFKATVYHTTLTYEGEKALCQALS